MTIKTKQGVKILQTTQTQYKLIYTNDIWSLIKWTYVCFPIPRAGSFFWIHLSLNTAQRKSVVTDLWLHLSYIFWSVWSQVTKVEQGDAAMIKCFITLYGSKPIAEDLSNLQSAKIWAHFYLFITFIFKHFLLTYFSNYWLI